MKRLIFLLCIMIATACTAQSNVDDKLYSKYSTKEYNGFDYVEIAKKVGWLPSKLGKFNGKFEMFEKAFPKVCENYSFQHQMHNDGCYYCSTNHDYLMQLYNKQYKTVSNETWDEYCPVLYILMHIDD